MARKTSIKAAPESKRTTITALSKLGSKTRVEALSDGIFAVAMTLLVLDIRLPDLHGAADSAQVLSALLNIWPKFVAFIVSFFFLARAWKAHRLIFQYISQVDYVFVYLTMVHLFVVCLLPFSASLIAEYPQTTVAAAIYSINLTLLPGVNYLMWREAVARDHLEKTASGANVGQWALKRYPKVVASIFVAFPLSFVRSELAIAWIVCWHVFFEARPFFKHDAH